MRIEELMSAVLNADDKKRGEIEKVLAGGVTGEEDVRTITTVEAARRLGCSEPTVRRMRKAGKLETMELNGTTRVLLSSLINYATRTRPSAFRC